MLKTRFSDRVGSPIIITQDAMSTETVNNRLWPKTWQKVACCRTLLLARALALGLLQKLVNSNQHAGIVDLFSQCNVWTLKGNTASVVHGHLRFLSRSSQNLSSLLESGRIEAIFQCKLPVRFHLPSLSGQ
jgi:hypothetical protein